MALPGRTQELIVRLRRHSRVAIDRKEVARDEDLLDLLSSSAATFKVTGHS